MFEISEPFLLICKKLISFGRMCTIFHYEYVREQVYVCTFFT